MTNARVLNRGDNIFNTKIIKKIKPLTKKEKKNNIRGKNK